MREDSLYLFDWTILGQPIRVSQMLSLVLVIAAVAVMFYHIQIKKATAETLWVNRVAAEPMESLAEEEEKPFVEE